MLRQNCFNRKEFSCEYLTCYWNFQKSCQHSPIYTRKCPAVRPWSFLSILWFNFYHLFSFVIYAVCFSYIKDETIVLLLYIICVYIYICIYISGYISIENTKDKMIIWYRGLVYVCYTIMLEREGRLSNYRSYTFNF